MKTVAKRHYRNATIMALVVWFVLPRRTSRQTIQHAKDVFDEYRKAVREIDDMA